MIFPYVMEGENSFYFNHYTSYSNSDQGCHSRGNSDGSLNTTTFLHSSATAQTTDMTLELGDRNLLPSTENLIFHIA